MPITVTHRTEDPKVFTKIELTDEAALGQTVGIASELLELLHMADPGFALILTGRKIEVLKQAMLLLWSDLAITADPASHETFTKEMERKVMELEQTTKELQAKLATL
jgi:hypothetical protein